MNQDKAKIGVVGVGMVGNAVVKYYEGLGVRVSVYDKYKNLGSLNDALSAEYVFLCLPSLTHKNGEQDLSAFDEIVPQLIAQSKVVIKSTVLPGTTERYQKMRPDVYLLHNPEFLDARTAVEDFAKPDVQVVGYTEISKPHAEAVMQVLPPAPHQSICRSAESEMIKYFLNTFMATKNTFANQMYDYCIAKGIDYEAVKNVVKHAPRMGGEVHLRILQDGYRGFQGACLPKDIEALTHDAESTPKALPLLELVRDLNRKYTAEGGTK